MHGDTVLPNILLLEPQQALERLCRAGFANVEVRRTRGWRDGQDPRVVKLAREGDALVMTVAHFPRLTQDK